MKKTLVEIEMNCYAARITDLHWKSPVETEVNECSRIVYTNNNPDAADLAESIIESELLHVRYSLRTDARGDAYLLVSGYEEDVPVFVELFKKALETSGGC